MNFLPMTNETRLPKREYHAVIWVKDPGAIGKRIKLWARSLEEAEGLLREEYGGDCVFTLTNEDDANAAR